MHRVTWYEDRDWLCKGPWIWAGLEKHKHTQLDVFSLQRKSIKYNERGVFIFQKSW